MASSHRLVTLRSHGQRQIIDRLYGLRRKIYLCGEQGFQSRVEFLCLAFQHGLGTDIRDYQLWDEGWEELGERQWDTCFEMGDAEQVIGEVVRRARAQGFIDSVREYCNMPGAFARWESYADRQSVLF
ncbi:MAG: hypothetical protein AB1642_00980 [Pseudomonadota bacterium]